MNNMHENQKVYRNKYKFMKMRIKSLILENAALCDEVAKVQESILIVKDERKYLLRKLLQFEHDTDTSHTHYRESNAATNGPRTKMKKRRSHEDNGKAVSVTCNNK